MNKLVTISYTDGSLDGETVGRIADRLTRGDLKLYIKALKNQENKTTLRVEVPSTANSMHLDELTKIFGQKKIVVSENPELLLGMRITDNDNVYNINLQNTLERIVTYATE